MVRFKDLRGPLNTTTNRLVVVVLSAGFLVALVVAAADVIRRIGGLRICAEIRRGGWRVDDEGVLSSLVRPGVQASTSGDFRTCVSEPTGGQRFAHIGIELPNLLFLIGCAVLLARFLWGAARPGPHSPVSPGRLAALGWFMIVAAPVTAIAGHYADFRLRQSMLSEQGAYPIEWFSAQWQHDFPWFAVFAGATAVLLARMLRIDVRLGEDMEGTV